ncbi:Limbic system-associated membrane protein [Cricetulus griseus]|uniref:Limbic system-associated membrane protein n=1 Tax=Cricetulus griseus TaxID=10029 RepID=G3HJM8_CRIGR|nr:Limbic system-associated membrane protein [Cricetulus griseus]ERE75690.1 limbic system-associated membrane protein [Cricetulus griseus]
MKTNRNGKALTELFCFVRCVVEDKNSKVAWLNRSGIIFAGHDKWSLDPRVELEKRHSLEYSLRIQKVDVYDEGSYTCSVQTQHEPKTSQVYLIVQVPPKISNISSDVTVNEGSNVTLVCMANGRPEPVITWRHLTPTVPPFSETLKKEICSLYDSSVACKSLSRDGENRDRFVQLLIGPFTVQCVTAFQRKSTCD